MRNAANVWVVIGALVFTADSGRAALAQDSEGEEASEFALARISPEIPRALSLAPLEDPLEQHEAHSEKHAELKDLTLFNFFSEGWGDDWVHRHRKTPDMALLRVTTNFLERELRLDYQGTPRVWGSATLRNSDFFNSLMAYALNRRLMIEVIANYQWNHLSSGSTVDGAGGAFLTRFQLVDTETSSFSFQMRASAPNKGITQPSTTLSPTLAGWQDLDAAFGLDRVGFYYSATIDTLAGALRRGLRTTALTYTGSLAKTWTEREMPVVGNFTTFLEVSATYDLNGPTGGRTLASLTPGIRFWFIPMNSLTFGVDLPINYPHTYSEVIRVTYILNF